MSNNRGPHTPEKQLTLFAGTWNVNGRSPESRNDIAPWLFPHSRDTRNPVDIFMLGLQEVQTLSGVDAVRTDPVRGLEWRKQIQSALGSDYDRIAERQLVGIMVFVFVRKNHAPYLSDVQLSYAATGFLNAVGNKGGVAARFLLYNRTISCVACHLAAHTGNVERRNQDFMDVVRKAMFLPLSSSQNERDSSDPILQNTFEEQEESQPQVSRISKSATDGTFINGASLTSGASANTVSTTSWLGSVALTAATAFYDISAGANTTVLNDPNAIKALDHDVVFWLGDLNYRVEAPLEEALELVRKEDWEKLIRYDQLQREMSNCEAFVGFREGPIRFAPTYKLERSTNEYAKDETGAIKRVPAYTDRILWRVRPDEDNPNNSPDLSLQEYSSAPSVFGSDHRPVFAIFQMSFGVEDFHRKRRVQPNRNNSGVDTREITKSKRSLQISASPIEFGDLFFEQESERTIKLRNVGDKSMFIAVKSSSTQPRWLRFDATRWQNVEIRPGQSKPLTVRALVTNEGGLANEIVSNGCNLETNISIFVKSENFDEILRIHGRYVATTLGLSLANLSLLQEPVLSLRRSNRPKLKDASRRSKYNDDGASEANPNPLPVPKEIWLLVDSLIEADVEGGQGVDRLSTNFLSNTEEAEIQRVVTFIDRAEQIPRDLSVDAIACCLLRVLAKMDESVIPSNAYKRAIEAGFADDIDLVRSVVDLLPPLNWNVFWYVIGFLCEISDVQRREERAKALVKEFAKVLIRSSNSHSNAREEKSKSSFVMAAIRHQLRSTPNEYATVIDLTNPETHPRKLPTRNV